MCVEGSWNNHNLLEATGRADANVHRVNSYYRNNRQAKIDLVIIPTDFDGKLILYIN